MSPIKFLADENIGFGVIVPLRKLGFDIKSVLEGNRGVEDVKILSVANKEKRILITADKDFGELVNARKLVHAGVILLRLKDDSSQNKLKVLRYLFRVYLEELRGAFTVIKDNLIRIGARRIQIRKN